MVSFQFGELDLGCCQNYQSDFSLKKQQHNISRTFHTEYSTEGYLKAKSPFPDNQPFDSPLIRLPRPKSDGLFAGWPSSAVDT